MLFIPRSQSTLAALFCIAACFPWAVKRGRCAVIFFFPPKRLHSFPGFVPAQLLVVQGDAVLLVPVYHWAFFFPEWHILMGHCLEQWSKAWCVSICEELLLFTILLFPSGSIRYQSSLQKQNKTINQPTKKKTKKPHQTMQKTKNTLKILSLN